MSSTTALSIGCPCGKDFSLDGLLVHIARYPGEADEHLVKELITALRASDGAHGEAQIQTIEVEKERDELRAANAEYRDCLIDCLYQWGSYDHDGETIFSTSGLSTMENIFELLGLTEARYTQKELDAALKPADAAGGED